MTAAEITLVDRLLCRGRPADGESLEIDNHLYDAIRAMADEWLSDHEMEYHRVMGTV